MAAMPKPVAGAVLQGGASTVIAVETNRVTTVQKFRNTITAIHRNLPSPYRVTRCMLQVI